MLTDFQFRIKINEFLNFINKKIDYYEDKKQIDETETRI